MPHNLNPNNHRYLSEVSFSAKHSVAYVGVFALLCGIYIYSSLALNPNLPGDVNNDNVVNITDKSILLSNYGTNYSAADFNSSGLVDITDLSILLSNYNKTFTPPPPPPPPPSTASCTKTASPGDGTLQALIDSLSSGQTGCLRAGTYTNSAGTLYFRKSGITITSYPGEKATITSYSEVSKGSIGVRLLNLNFNTTERHNIRIYGNDTVMELNNLTNNHAVGAGACIGVGGSIDIPSGVVIKQNYIHDCGSNSDSLNHGIYANGFVDLVIVDNVFWNNGGYSIQLYPNGTRAVVSHNVIDGSSEYSTRGGIVIGGDVAAIDHIIEYNVISYAKTEGINQKTGSGHIARYNCFYSNLAGDITGSNISSVGNINVNPQFVNRQTRDYALSSGSGCLSVVQYDTAKKLKALGM